MDTLRAQATVRRVGDWSAIGLGFTLPIWTLADSLLMTLLIACWVGVGGWRDKLHRIRSNPVAMAAVLLFAWLLLGTLWGEGSLEDRVVYLKKYGELLFIPLLLTLVSNPLVRGRALLGFSIGLIVTLVLSYAIWFGLVSPASLIKGSASNPFVFKKHITHNILMAFGALLFVMFAWKSADIRWRWGWGVLAVLAVCNVMLMVQGRTAYLIVPALAILFLYAMLGWKGIAAAMVLVGTTFIGAYGLSTSFHNRVEEAVVNANNWSPEVAANDAVTERLEFYYNTVEIIRGHPLFGVGTGGFAEAYAKHVVPKGLAPTRNPHNQYLLVMAQVGVVGLLLLLWLFVQQWLTAAAIIDPSHRMLARGLVLTMAIGCVFNALLIDHTEKLMYCWFSGLFYAEVGSRSDSTV